MPSIKDVLTWELQRREWNAYRLEELSGVDQPTIHRLLTGKTTSPRQKTLKALADALNLSIGQLCGHVDIPGYPSNKSENSNINTPPPILLSPKKRQMALLMDELTEDQQDELIAAAAKLAEHNKKVIAELSRRRYKTE